jgi:uncharacterized protein YjiS (DUF1127 family)
MKICKLPGARRRQHWAARLRAILTRLISAAKAELRARRAAAELARMDDCMLRDIGIARSEIESAVRRKTRESDRNAPPPPTDPSANKRLVLIHGAKDTRDKRRKSPKTSKPGKPTGWP